MKNYYELQNNETLIVYLHAISSFAFMCRQENYIRKIEKSVAAMNARKIAELAKLKCLMSLPQDSIMDYFDLSNDSIRKFPDLSKYTIRTLDLSFNLLDTFIEGYLPQKIERLIRRIIN